MTRLLSRYGITATLADGDMDLASDELDGLRPFIGSKYVTDGTQVRQFPRSLEPDGSVSNGSVPENILDAVSLLAYEYVQDEGPPIRSENIMSANVVYERPKRSVNRRRIDALLRPYLVTRGYTPSSRPVLRQPQ